MEKSKSKRHYIKGIKLFSHISIIVFFVVAIVVFAFTRSYSLASIFVILCYTFVFVFLTIDWILSDDLNLNIFGVTILVLLTSPLLVYGLILLVRFLEPSLSNVPILVADSKTWIGFAGSVIGGSMVMLALIFTIRHDRYLRLDEKRTTLTPYIDIYIQEEKGVLDGILNKIHFVIENASNNPVRDYKFKIFINHKRQCPPDDTSNYTGESIILVRTEIPINGSYGNIIHPRKSTSVLANILDKNDVEFMSRKSTLKESIIPYYITMDFDFEVIYYDILKLRKYIHTTNMKCHFCIFDNFKINNMLPIMYSHKFEDGDAEL